MINIIKPFKNRKHIKIIPIDKFNQIVYTNDFFVAPIHANKLSLLSYC